MRHWKLKTIFFSALILIGYFVFNGFSFRFPPECDYIDDDVVLSEDMRKYEVIFSKDLIFQNKEERQWIKTSKRCPTILSEVHSDIWASNNVGGAPFTGTFSKGTHFRIVGHKYISTNGWADLRGKSGEWVVLMDDKGQKYMMHGSSFMEGEPTFVNGNILLGPAKLN